MEASRYFGSISMPRQRRPVRSHAISVAPPPQKGIENHVAARGAVQNRIGDHQHGLRCGVLEGQTSLFPGTTEG